MDIEAFIERWSHARGGAERANYQMFLTELCEALAWPDKARPEHSHGVRFFSAVRDLTATGFFTSKIGIEDLQYTGNTFVPKWTGAPKPALDHLGVSYEPLAKWYTESM